jgi:hypothetical protein
MRSRQLYKLFLALALIGYGISYFPSAWDIFAHIILAAYIHPENLRYCVPRSYSELPDYFSIIVAPLFMIAGFGLLLNQRWAVFFSLFSAIIGFIAFPFGTILSCCVFLYNLFCVDKNKLQVE